MIETLGQGSDWLTWIDQFKHHDHSASAGSVDPHGQLHVSRRAASENTDHLLNFPCRSRTSDSHWDYATGHSGPGWANRARWLQEHDVHTQFLDGGIGGCWCAQQGDDEPVYGETEEAVIARLVRESADSSVFNR